MPGLFRLLPANRQNLWRLSWLRLLVFATQAGSLLFVYLSQLVELAWLPLLLVMSVAALVYSLTALRLRMTLPVTELELAVQLGFDLLIHSILLYYTGGSTNPFVAYYLVPLTIAAATLHWIYPLVLSALALTGYTALQIWYQPLSLNGNQYDPLLISMHLFGMWLNFAFSAALITLFVARMAAAVREQEELQAVRREEAMRDQQLLAVATQAAGAAHELGTPLSTMTVLLTELKQEHKDEAELQEDLSLLQKQVHLCRDTLQSLVRAAEADRQQSAREQSLRGWLEYCINRWHLMRPEATFTTEFQAGEDMPNITPPADLTQAMLNLLNNAADACHEDLLIQLSWNDGCVDVRIFDRGAGVPAHAAEQLGKPFITTKGKGLGLGLFLSQASVTRAGGTVKLIGQEGGGTMTELCLPRNGTLFS